MQKVACVAAGLLARRHECRKITRWHFDADWRKLVWEDEAYYERRGLPSTRDNKVIDRAGYMAASGPTTHRGMLAAYTWLNSGGYSTDTFVYHAHYFPPVPLS
jgi:hypothetical protein